MFFLLCANDIDKIYDSDDDLPLTQMVLQCTIGISTEDEDKKDDDNDEGYEDCVVMADDLYDEENEDLDDEQNVEIKGKYVVTEF